MGRSGSKVARGKKVGVHLFIIRLTSVDEELICPLVPSSPAASVVILRVSNFQSFKLNRNSLNWTFILLVTEFPHSQWNFYKN